VRTLGLALVSASLLLSSPVSAGTISITFVLTAGSGSWTSNQSGGAISLGQGSVVLEMPGTSAVSPTGSVATILQLFATGLGPLLNAHSLQLVGLPGQIIGTHPGGFTASGGAGTMLGAVGGPSGVLPLMSFAAVLFDVSNVGTSGAASFRLLGGNFGGASAATITQTFVGTEVSRTYLPEPSTGLLLALGVGAAWALVGRRGPGR